MDDAGLNAVHFVSASTGWAVGDRGAIWHTNDGENWRLQKSPVPYPLYAVHFVDEQNGWIVGGRVRDYADQTEGFVLHTDNGGRTWIRSKATSLPNLRSIHFNNKKEGFAAGDSSELYPSGMMVTNDGGLSWKNSGVRGRTRWQSMSVRNDLGLAIDDFGMIKSWSRGHSQQQSTPHVPRGSFPKRKNPFARMRRIVLTDSQAAFACGDEGCLWKSVDQGQTWQDLRNVVDSGPNDAVGNHLKGIAARGNVVCVAGSKCILRSGDAGRTWHRIAVECPQLTDIQFADESTAYAVGALGEVLRTDDAGETWRFQRGSHRTVAVLLIADNPECIPWPLVAHIGGSYGGRVRLVAMESTPNTPGNASMESRISNATLAAGGSCSQTWHKSLSPAERKRQIALEVQQWRPEVIIVSSANQPNLTVPQNGSIAAIVHELQNEFATSLKFYTCELEPIGATQAALSPSSTAQQLAVSLGTTVGSLADTAYSKTQSHPRTRAAGTQLKNGIGQGRATARSLIRGLSSQSGRRITEQPTAEQWQTLQEQASIHARIHGLLKQVEHSQVSANGIQSQIQVASAGLDATSAGRILYKLAHIHLQNGDREAALKTIDRLAIDYPAEDSSSAGIRDAIQLATSSEVRIAQKARASENQQTTMSSDQDAAHTSPDEALDDENESAPKIFKINTRFGQARTYSPDFLVVDPTESSRRQPLQQVTFAAPIAASVDIWNPKTWADRANPILRADPRVAFPIEAHRRRTAKPGRRQLGVYQRLHRKSKSAVWRACASRELAQWQPQRVTAKSELACPTVPRPRLDGILSDSTWTKATIQPLATSHDGHPATSVWLGRDHHHLLIAVAAECDASIEYQPTQTAGRQHDAEVESMDRVSFFIDIDRDYASAWKITVDQRGCTSESLMSDRDWNPKYFVASQQGKIADGTSMWFIEMAIPFSELSEAMPSDQAAWAFGVERRIPGQTTMAWPVETNLEENLEQLGILNFGTTQSDPDR